MSIKTLELTDEQKQRVEELIDKVRDADVAGAEYGYGFADALMYIWAGAPTGVADTYAGTNYRLARMLNEAEL